MSKKNRRPNGEGCIRKRQNGLWECIISIGYDPNTGKRRRISFYSSTQKGVIKKREAFLEAVKKENLEGDDITVSELGERYLEHHYKFVEAAESTKDTDNCTLKLICKYVGQKLIREMTTCDVDYLLLTLKAEGYGKSYITKVRCLLFNMFQMAVAHCKVNDNVVAYAQKIRHNKSARKETFTAEEVQLMMKDLPQDKIGWSIRLLLVLGLRKGELLGLEKRHIAQDGSAITIDQAVARSKGTAFVSDTKSAAGRRVIPVPEAARKYAQLLRESCEGDLIWESPRKPGCPVNPSYFDDLYRRALERIEMRFLPPHCMRHTMVSQLQAQGVPLETIQSIVGHTEVKVTTNYLHVQENVRKEAMERLNILCVE